MAKNNESKSQSSSTRPHRIDSTPFRIKPGAKVRLKDFDPASTGPFTAKDEAVITLAEDVQSLAAAQDLLYASDTYSILLIFQAMDAAGKDSVIKHVMSGVNPQGCQVFSFKHPSAEDLDHNFLWRYSRSTPERGRIGIFNRSYYEEVLIVRVHPEILAAQRIPSLPAGGKVWRERYDDINNFERHLTRNGTLILKFFLNVSKEEQRRRFLARLNDERKNWKFSAGDVRERGFWDDYMKAYEAMLSATSTEYAPWFVIPADKKWFTRACVADIITSAIEKLKLNYPSISEAKRAELQKAKTLLEKEPER
jgi:PPK2 family polyphosphate:nucleotide phosphotransferase